MLFCFRDKCTFCVYGGICSADSGVGNSRTNKYTWFTFQNEVLLPTYDNENVSFIFRQYISTININA